MISNLSIPRMVRPDELRYLIGIVKDHQPKRILEIGAALGAVSWHFLANSDAELHTVDPWGGFTSNFRVIDDLVPHTVTLEGWKNTVKKFGKRAIPYYCRSQDVELEGKFDLIWIDGDHSYDAVINDLELAQQHLETGGVLIGHDTLIPSTREAVEHFAKQYDWTMTEPLDNIWRLS